METTERLVRTWMASGRDQEVEQAVSGISDGQTSLLNIVKALGEYLTAEEGELRTKGVEFLSAVLSRCPPDKIPRQPARVLITFYCDKLDDTETIIPAMKGLSSLVSLPVCLSGDAVEILRALFANAKMQALEQSARFLVFSIIDTLMARHREALQNMGKDFLSNYVVLAEGEKDPRNLIVAFAIARVILIEFDISDHVESLFNITFCYFPISFRPPPDYQYSVTADDLKVGLRACLNATPAFGLLAIPLFLDKLTAGSPATKRDTLQTMSSCFPVYGAALARGSARKLWSALKLEIFQPIDPITEEEALECLQTLIRTIYADDGDGDEVMETEIQGLARDACEECIQILREPEKSQARPATKVLCAFMATTPSVSRYTISQAVPHFVKLFLNPDEISNRPATLMLLADLISSARDSSNKLSTPSISSDQLDVPLTPFKDEVLGVLTVGLNTAASRRSALDGLKGMVTTKLLLTDEELGFIVHNINEILQADKEETDDTSDSALDLLSSISAINTRHVEEQTLPLLFSSLPDRPPPREAIAERAKCWRVLSALTKLCLQPQLFETFVIRLSTKLDLICVPPSKLEEDVEPAAAYAHSILTTIANTLSAKVDKGHADIPKYIDRLVPRLHNLFIYSALLPDGKYIASTDPRVVRVAAQIITLVMQTLSVQKQEVFASALFSAYLNGEYKHIAVGHQKIPADSHFYPFGAAASNLEKNLAALFSAAVIALHKEIAIPIVDSNDFINTLLKWSLSETENSLQRDAVCHVISSVVNKRAEDVSTLISEQLDLFWSREISDATVSPERRCRAIDLWVWICKGLLIRNNPDCVRFTDRLFEVFDDDAISWDAAKAIGEVCGSDKILTKRNHAIIKLLYAQRFFNRILPRIIEGAKDSVAPRRQTAYIVALTSLIKSIPKSTYAHEMPKLMPLLLRGLDLPDMNIRADVIDTLLAAAEGGSTEQSIVSEHASTLVSIMLRNSTVQEMASTRVRTAALRYLAILPSIVRYDILHPYKPTVIRELAIVLDDPKRSVRKEAVDARTNWFKYNG